MLRVMLLLTDLERGGLPLRIARLAPRLAEAGLDPVVGCLKGTGPLSKELERAGIPTFACWGRGKLDASCLMTLSRQIRRFGPDLLHGSLFHANVAARLVGRIDHLRPIITATVTIEIERTWHRWVESLTGHMSDYHVANSHAVAKHLVIDLGLAPERVVTIPNAIDTEELARTPPASRAELGIDDATPLVVWAGRMDPVKNLEMLVETIAGVSSRRKVAAVVIGSGPEQKKIERLIAGRGLGDVIRLIGWQAKPERWFKIADVLLFPSWTEGSSNVVLEALACGCDVVAGDIPANRELLVGCDRARLCAPDDVGGFVRSLNEHLSRVREVRQGLPAWLANRHSMGAVTTNWMTLYSQAIERRPVPNL